MRSPFRPGVGVGMIMLMALAACSPAVRAPAATPLRVAPSPVSTPAATVPTQTPQDAAWAKTVAAAQREGKVTIYSYNFGGDIGIAVSRAFKDRYGIDLDIITGRGAAFIERLKTEKRMGSILADVADQNPVNAKMMQQEGFTTGIGGELPALQDNNVWVADIFARDPQNRQIIAYNFSIYTPFVNTNLVKPGDEPKAWKDFLDPKWKSKISVLDPTTSSGLLEVFIPLMREKVIDENFIKLLYSQDLRVANGYPDEGAMIARGERSISLSSSDHVYSPLIAQGAPLKAVALSDGTILGTVVLVAFNGGPHPNAAKVYINWLMSQEGQTVLGKAFSVGSVRKDVANFLPQAAQIAPKRPIIQTNEDSDAATKLFQDRWLNKLWGR